LCTLSHLILLDISRRKKKPFPMRLSASFRCQKSYFWIGRRHDNGGLWSETLSLRACTVMSSQLFVI
jgi:hypothetical protein